MPLLEGNIEAEAMGDVSNRGRTFDITVDASNVEHLLDAVTARLSGANLAIFLREDAHRQMRDEIMWRFANEGDAKSGDWEQLTDTTQDIRAALGFNPSHPINVRTGDMFLFLQDSYELTTGPNYAELQVPGDVNDPVLQQKIEHAQQGTKDNPIAAFGSTPARPVIVAPDDKDIQELLESLQAHVMLSVAGALL